MYAALIPLIEDAGFRVTDDAAPGPILTTIHVGLSDDDRVVISGVAGDGSLFPSDLAFEPADVDNLDQAAAYAQAIRELIDDVSSAGEQTLSKALPRGLVVSINADKTEVSFSGSTAVITPTQAKGIAEGLIARGRVPVFVIE